MYITLCVSSGAGNFGSVMKGVCRVGDKDIPVAVKTLKNADLEPGIQVGVCDERRVSAGRQGHSCGREDPEE